MQPEGVSPYPEHQEGSLFEDRYRILSVLGKGGMSVVFRAQDLLLEREVALKLLHPAAFASQRALVRFRNEAKASSNLRHPHIVQILAFGISGAGHPYIVMELLEGRTLADLLDTEKRLQRNEFLERFLPVLDALAFAHQLGIIHRDLKPSNIFLHEGSNGQTVHKVLDFGIAHIERDNKTQETLTVAPIGTPLYMSPEQCLNLKVDGRSDIYSLACVMYEALAGKPPFYGQTPLETMYEHIHRTAPDFNEISGPIHIPPQAVSVLRKAMAKEPASRFGSMEQFKQALMEAFSSSNRSRDVHKGANPAKHRLWLPLAVIASGAICCLLPVMTGHHTRESRSSSSGKPTPADLAAPASRVPSRSRLTSQGPYPLAKRGTETLGRALDTESEDSAAVKHSLLLQAEEDLRLGLALVQERKIDDRELLYYLHQDLGNVLRHVGRREEAVAEYRKAKAVYAGERQVGSERRLVASRQAAFCLAEIGKRPEARAEYLAGIADFERDKQATSLELAYSYYELGREAAADELESYRCYSRALTIGRALHCSPFEISIAEAELKVAEYEAKHGKPARLDSVLNSMEKLMDSARCTGDSLIDRSSVYESIAMRWLSRGNRQASLRLFEKALADAERRSSKRAKRHREHLRTTIADVEGSAESSGTVRRALK